MDKNYINGFVVKEKEFDNGGKQLKVSIAVSDFIKQLEELKSKNGNDWANVIIAKRREPSDKGVTHYMYEDTWKPDKNKNDSEIVNRVKEVFNEEEDLPF